jgi:O-antigen/teichoic acid export membrane protein
VAAEQGALTTGSHERRLATGAIAQQLSGAAGAVAMFVAITVLARSLSLAELGTYGLLVSFAAYLLFVQSSIETASVKAIAEAADHSERNSAFSTAVSLYVAAGVLSGAVIAVAGIGALGLFEIPDRLHHQAEVGVLALGAVTAVGWPLKAFQDVLRGTQRFVAAAAAEGVGIVTVGAALVGLAIAGAPLWALVATGGAVPFAVGLASALVMLVQGVRCRYERTSVTGGAIRGFLGISGYLFLGGLAELVIYSVDRAILAAFRPATVVGLYEGPVRAHSLLQQVHSSLATPVVAASARYVAEQDAARTRDLLIRGMRYTLAAVVPLALVLMILAAPILEVWLGARFETAAPAMAVLASYWLLNGCTGVPGRMLITAGKVRVLTAYAVAVALANVSLSLALTPSLGLNGVVLGTAIAFTVAFPFFVWIVLSVFPVRLVELTREVWVPAYTTGVLVGVGLLLIRHAVSLHTVPAVVAAAAGAVLTYWVLFYAVWLRPSERALVKAVSLAALGRR